MTEQHECKDGHDLMLVYSGPMSFHCKRKGCNFIIPYDKAMNMLNEYETLKKATEALSADDAREYSPCIRRDCIAPPCECADALLAYADILEGK